MDRILNSPPIVDKSNFKEFFKDYQTRSSTHYALDEFKLDDNKKRVDAHSLKEFKENILTCVKFPEPIIYAVWEADASKTEENDDIFFSYSTDGGKSFSSSINISNSSSSSTDPRIAAFDNHVYVVWEEGFDDDGDTEESIFFIASDDFGQTFGTLKKLTEPDRFDASDPDVAAFKNNVYVAWENGSENDDELFFVASNDNGKTFGDIQNLSNDDFLFWRSISCCT